MQIRFQGLGPEPYNPKPRESEYVLLALETFSDPGQTSALGSIGLWAQDLRLWAELLGL